jgi:glutathione S-transferase
VFVRQTLTVLRLYGTLTSPYVRRVRVVALELGIEHALIETASEAGLATLRSITPIWKVPVAEFDGVTLFDSAVINEALIAAHGPGPLADQDPRDTELCNVMTVIDGVLDSLINVFYLGRDGVTPATASYLQKHLERAASGAQWLDERVLDGQWLTEARRFGLAEIALTTTLGWMRFRDTYPIERHPALVACFDQHSARASMRATLPPS